MFHNISDTQCTHCKPDCETTIYSTKVTYADFGECSHQNLGSSFLCNLNNALLPDPKIWSGRVRHTYESRYGYLPEYIEEQVQT